MDVFKKILLNRNLLLNWELLNWDPDTIGTSIKYTYYTIKNNSIFTCAHLSVWQETSCTQVQGSTRISLKDEEDEKTINKMEPEKC